MVAEKSELKALIADGFAAEFLDSKDKSFRQIALYQGAAEGLQRAEKVINAVSQQTREELINKGIPFDPTQPVEVGKYVVGQLMAAVRNIHELADNATTSAIRAEGALQAYEQMIIRLSSAATEERAKAKAQRQAEAVAADNGDLAPQGKFAPRPLGTHPGPPMSEERLAQAVQAEPDNGEAKGNGKAKSKAKAKSSPSKSQKRRKAIQKKEPDARDT